MAALGLDNCLYVKLTVDGVVKVNPAITPIFGLIALKANPNIVSYSPFNVIV